MVNATAAGSPCPSQWVSSGALMLRGRAFGRAGRTPAARDDVETVTALPDGGPPSVLLLELERTAHGEAVPFEPGIELSPIVNGWALTAAGAAFQVPRDSAVAC